MREEIYSGFKERIYIIGKSRHNASNLHTESAGRSWGGGGVVHVSKYKLATGAD